MSIKTGENIDARTSYTGAMEAAASLLERDTAQLEGLMRDRIARETQDGTVEIAKLPLDTQADLAAMLLEIGARHVGLGPEASSSLAEGSYTVHDITLESVRRRLRGRLLEMTTDGALDPYSADESVRVLNDREAALLGYGLALEGNYPRHMVMMSAFGRAERPGPTWQEQMAAFFNTDYGARFLEIDPEARRAAVTDIGTDF